MNRAARDTLAGLGFVEVETPTLTRSTPEGARDFLVPARLSPGSWYALPQSPQLFKQLLMVAGLERYYQIARCYRDEDFRADRQPEFTQLDLEMSFVDTDDVIDVAERVLTGLWALVGHDLPRPIPRMTYAEAMARFGSDKPDLRFGVELTDCTAYFAETPFRVFQADYVGAVVMPGGGSQPRRTFDGWQDWARQRGARGLAYVIVGDDGELSGPVAKNLSATEAAGLAVARRRRARRLHLLRRRCGEAVPGPARCGAGGDRPPLRPRSTSPPGRSSGSSTRRCSSRRPKPERPVTWPWAPAPGPPCTTRSPSPKPESEDLLDTDPGSALAHAYDIVCNGNEIGGGSIRIHRRDVQERVFAVMGIDAQAAAEKFGFLLEAFAFGAPPHGGIAFGWDRIVALLAGAESIRDVIAFPKSGGGQDPLTGAPAPITEQQRKEAGVRRRPGS